MKSLFLFVLSMLLFAVPACANNKKWDVPCQKVFVTGTQTHEIAWALTGEGLNNNLYRNTCMQPVSDASKADAILDVEIDPKVAGATEARIRDRENAIVSGNYWVSCSSNRNGSSCSDSTGNMLVTSCNTHGCSTYYGPNPLLVATNLLGDAISAWAERSAGWGYLYDAKDHHLIWKYEGNGQWHADLATYSQCKKKAGQWGPYQHCKTPTALLPD